MECLNDKTTMIILVCVLVFLSLVFGIGNYLLRKTF